MTDRPTLFVILAAERTGTNLLRGLLESHPQVFVGGEIFNEYNIQSGYLAWPLGDNVEDDPELKTLRQRDPVALLGQLFDLAAQQGYRAIGFKLMYCHGTQHPAVLDYLKRDQRIRVVHVTRRNRLRRFLSHERARATNVWMSTSGTETVGGAPPTVQLDFVECIKDFAAIEQAENAHREHFAGHPIHEVCYEDLAADPQGVGSATARFLGVDADQSVTTVFRKQSSDSLRAAISNYDDLRAKFASWQFFFDD